MAEQLVTGPEGTSEAPKRRTVRRWAIAAAFAPGIALVGLLVWSIRGCTSEVDRLPWPGSEVSARDAAYVNLASLGLDVSQVQDASEAIGQGRYAEGIQVQYDRSGTKTVTIAVLKYADAGSASQDFASYEEWAKQNAATWLSFNTGSLTKTGWLKLTFRGSRSRVMWHGDWIVEVVVAESGTDAGALLDGVIDAMARHWAEIKGGNRTGVSALIMRGAIWED